MSENFNIGVNITADDLASPAFQKALDAADAFRARMQQLAAVNLALPSPDVTGLITGLAQADQALTAFRDNLRVVAESVAGTDLAAGLARQAEQAIARSVQEQERAAQQQTQIVERLAQQEIDVQSRADAQKLQAQERAAQQLVQVRQTYADAVVAADTRMEQTEQRTDERMMEIQAAAAGRLLAVAERTEAARLIGSSEGAAQRLRRAVEAESQMTTVLQESEAARNRIVQGAEVTRLRSVMEAAQAQVRVVQENGVASTQMLTGVRQEALRAEQVFQQANTQLVQTQEAERTRIVQQAAQAQSAIRRQVQAEQASLMVGGGPGGLLANVMGGGGGAGGLVSMLGSAGGITGVLGGVAGAAGGVLGVAGGALGAAFTGLREVGTAALSALTAPVRLLGDAFSSITGVIGNATQGLQQFLLIGAGLYGLYQVVNTLQNAFTEWLRGAVDFQTQMARLRVTSGETTAQMREQSAATLEISMTTGQSATEIARAMNLATSGNFTAAESYKIVDQAARLSAAGMGSTAEITRVLAGEITAYGDSADNATHYADVFARTIQTSHVPVDELISSISRVVPIAAALHIPLEQVGADIATISQTGLNSSRVMTDLTAVFNQFLKDSPAQREALQGMGLSLEQVRQTLMDKGLIAAAEQIWQASGRDIDAVGKIFGDRARALVGFLSLVEDGGTRAEQNLRRLQQSGGTAMQVFEAALNTLAVGWQRFTNIFQAFVIVAGENVLPGLTTDLRNLDDALQAGNFVAAGQAIVTAFQDISSNVLHVFESLAQSMFGAGANIVGMLAQGIASAVDSVLTAVVGGVADLIAGVLLGGSWPPAGPLSHGASGVQAWQQAYAQAMRANANIMTDAASDVAQQVNAALAVVGSTGAGAGATRKDVTGQINAIKDQLLPWQIATEQIKANYEEQVRPLDDQIRALNDIKDIEYERLNAQYKQQDAELALLKLRAEGDPAKRAQIAAQIENQRFKEEGDRIRAEEDRLHHELATLSRSHMSPSERRNQQTAINDQLTMLHLQEQQHNLVNTALLGQYNQRKATLTVQEAQAAAEHAAFTAQKDLTLEPLIAQRDALKAREDAELTVLTQHTSQLDAQLRVLERINTERGKGAGAAGVPFVVPEQDAAAAQKAIDERNQKIISGIAENLRTRLQTGPDEFFAKNGNEIGTRAIGFIVGGMAFGLPGAMLGQQLAPMIANALTERGITADDWTRFVTNANDSLRTAWQNISKPLAAGDILGSVDAFKTSIGEWVGAFQKAMFSEWYTTPQYKNVGSELVRTGTAVVPGLPNVDEMGMALGASLQPPGTTRQTGLGRTVIEALFGQQDASLNYQTAYNLLDKNVFQPVLKAITDWWDKFTMPQVLDPNEPGKKGPSNAEQLGRGILSVIDNAFQWVDSQANTIESAGKALGSVIAGAVTYLTTDDAAKKTLGDGMYTLGASVGGRFFAGMLSGTFSNVRVPDAPTPEEAGAWVTTRQRVPADISKGPTTDFLQSIIGTAGSWLEAGKNAIAGLTNGVNDTAARQTLKDSQKQVVADMLGAVQEAGDGHSPWRMMIELGKDAVLGLNEGINQNAASTAVAVRTWLSADVLAQAKAILQGGGGVSDPRDVGGAGGGLKGVAQEAVQELVTFFNTPNAQLDLAAQRLGEEIADNLKKGIMSTPFNITLKGEVTAGTGGAVPPRIPTRGGTPLPQAQYGGDWTVSGTGGTDSQLVQFMATPGERVTVTPGGGGTGDGGVVVNGPLVHVEHLHAGEQGEIDSMLDQVREFLVNDVRTARGQGVVRPGTIVPRGAR